jgi:hypothetical protein
LGNLLHGLKGIQAGSKIDLRSCKKNLIFVLLSLKNMWQGLRDHLKFLMKRNPE